MVEKETLKDDIIPTLSGEYINEEESRWDYICRLCNESIYYKGDDEN